VSPSPADYEVWGAHEENGFYCIWSLKEHIGYMRAKKIDNFDIFATH